MADVLIYLSYIGIILLIGLISSLICKKIKIPSILMLIIVGILIGEIKYQGRPLMEFPVVFLTSIGILALVMVVFDSTSRLKLKEIDTFSSKVLKVTLISIVLNLILLGGAVHLILGVGWVPALIFAAITAGTAPDVVMGMIPETKNKVLEILKIESVFNTPFTVLIPFIIIDLSKTIEIQSFVDRFLEQILPFLQLFVTGIGAGILVGLILFKAIHRTYHEKYSPVALLVAAILTYVLAENLGGSGVLGVTALGLLFGNVYIREKKHLEEFSLFLATVLGLLIFVLIGIVIEIDINLNMIIISLSLFLIYLLIRFISVHFSVMREHNTKEKIFMTLNCPKGIAVAVTVFILSSYSIAGLQPVLNMVLLFLLYSLILSTFVSKFSQFFIRAKVIK